MFVLRILPLALAAGGAVLSVSTAYAGGVSSSDAGAPITFADNAPEVVLVSARRREEAAQDVPIGLAVVPVDRLEMTGTYNVSGLAQLVPTVQFFSSNPRNTAITIRGLGTSFGL